MTAAFDYPLNPAPLPDPEPGVPRPRESAAVAQSLVYAHQSTYGEDTLNVEIDAPTGVTVRVNLNDDLLVEVRTP